MTPRPPRRVVPLLMIALCLAAAFAPAQAEARSPAAPGFAAPGFGFAAHDLALASPCTACAVADLDGDGIDDLLVVMGRCFRVFPGQKGAKPDPEGPLRKFADDVVCFDLAPRPAGGACTAARRRDDSVLLDFHRPAAADRREAEAEADPTRPVFRAKLLYAPHGRSGVMLVSPGDGADHLVDWARDAKNPSRLSAPRLSLRHEHRLHVSGADLLDRISADAAPPGVAFGDADGDGRMDVIAIRPNRLDVHPADENDAFAATPSAHVPRPSRSVGTRLLRSMLPPILRDLTGDGRLDLIDIDANRGQMRFHRGPLVGAKAAAPVRFRFDGVLLDVTPVDVDGDGRLDLRALVAETVDLVRGARMFVTGALAVRALTFRQAENGSFPVRAHARYDFKLPITADLSVSPPRARPLPVWSYDADFDDDGRPDLVARVARGRLGIHRADAAGGFAPDPAPELDLGAEPGSRPSALRIGDLDGDGRPDLAVVMDPGRSGRGRIRLFLSSAR